jgi:hypothetical protein
MGKFSRITKVIRRSKQIFHTAYEAATGLKTWFTLPDLKTIVAPPLDGRWPLLSLLLHILLAHSQDLFSVLL